MSFAHQACARFSRPLSAIGPPSLLCQLILRRFRIEICWAWDGRGQGAVFVVRGGVIESFMVWDPPNLLNCGFVSPDSFFPFPINLDMRRSVSLISLVTPAFVEEAKAMKSGPCLFSSSRMS